MRRSLAATALGILLGACPNFEGAPCDSDGNCPGSQHCVANPAAVNLGRCVDGARVKGDFVADAGVDAGFDAGPACAAAPLAGTFTLNGTSALPNFHDAWVDVWDHPPQLTDGGLSLESPQFQVQVDPAALTYAVPGVAVGHAFYVSGEYDLSGAGDAGDLVDNLVSAPVEVVAGFNPACNLGVEVTTLRVCSVASSSISFLGAPDQLIIDLVVDVPDVTSGTELSVAAVQETDPDGGSTVPRDLMVEPNPLTHDGGILSLPGNGAGLFPSSQVWAKEGGLSPPGGGAGSDSIPAVAGVYRFNVSADHYSLEASTCAVPVSILDPAPVVGAPQTVDGGLSITWSSTTGLDAGLQPGSHVEFYDQLHLATLAPGTGISFQRVWSSPLLPPTPAGGSNTLTVPTSNCGTAACYLLVVSAREQVSGVGTVPVGVSLETAVTILTVTQ